jgi:hypothetical protein
MPRVLSPKLWAVRSEILLLVKNYTINLLIKIYMWVVRSKNIIKNLYNQFADKNLHADSSVRNIAAGIIKIWMISLFIKKLISIFIYRKHNHILKRKYRTSYTYSIDIIIWFTGDDVPSQLTKSLEYVPKGCHASEETSSDPHEKLIVYKTVSINCKSIFL